MLKFESLTQTGLPSHLTFVVPFAVSEDLAMFGYGIGIGPAGDGVLHTSGKAIVVPLLDACTTERKLTPTVTGMSTSSSGQLMLTVPPRILLDCVARLTIFTPRTITVPSRRMHQRALAAGQTNLVGGLEIERRLSSCTDTGSPAGSFACASHGSASRCPTTAGHDAEDDRLRRRFRRTSTVRPSSASEAAAAEGNRNRLDASHACVFAARRTTSARRLARCPRRRRCQSGRTRSLVGSGRARGPAGSVRPAAVSGFARRWRRSGVENFWSSRDMSRPRLPTLV